MRKWIQLIITLLVVIIICMPLSTIQMDNPRPVATALPTAATETPVTTEAPVGDIAGEATAAATVVPTAVPTQEPTPVPTAEPTPTVEPTAVPELPACLPVNNGSRDTEGDTTIQQIQQRLIDLNYLFDVADGVFGSNSTNAVFAFQAANGLPEYGIVDEATYYALYSDDAIAAPEPTPTPMGRGASGDEVREVQEKLVVLGFLPFEPDGSYGVGTQKGVKAFQQYLHDYGATLATLEMPSLLTSAETAVPSATPVAAVTTEPTAEPAETPLPQLPAALPLKLASRDSDTDTSVSKAQQRLADLGYLNDTVDGAFGQNSANAVSRFQRAFGLPESGQIDADTWYALFSYQAECITPAPTLEPTPTPYAPNGEIDEELLTFIHEGEFDVYRQDVRTGDQNADAFRVQRRLASLNYMYTDACDGAFGSTTELALKYFQRLNHLPETGVADEATQLKLFHEMAIRSEFVVYSYCTTVDVSDQRVYIYEWTGDGYSAEPLKTFVCSTGTVKTPTPLGTFSGAGRATTDRWYHFKEFNCYAQYAYRITGGILFHSVTYDKPNEKTLQGSTLRNLGRRASHGCIRLKVEDAKWIFDNCPAGMTITIQN